MSTLLGMAVTAVAVFCVALVIEWLFDGSSDEPWRPSEMLLALAVVVVLLLAALLSAEGVVDGNGGGR